MSVDWNACYHEGETPWDKGEPHPALPFLLEEHRDLLERAGSLLVPGCGTGHDARFLAEAVSGPVTGLDVAEEAIRRAREKDRKERVRWELGDFFTWEQPVELIFEHTCFCAIPVDRRPDYVAAAARLLPPAGHLLGVFFLNPDHEGEEGPPFGVGRDALFSSFEEFFEVRWSQAPARTYPGREGEGRELCVLLERRG